MRKEIYRLGIIGLFLVMLAIAGCGGGDSTPVAATDPETTNPDNTASAIAGFDFTLQEGDFWEYVWTYKQSTTSADPSPGESDVGRFKIALGAPQMIDGKTAFPVIISGKRTDPAGFTYAANLTHIALDGDQILISTDGVTLRVIFDAATAKATGGFFAPLGLIAAADVSPVTVDNQFVKNTPAYRVGGSTDDPLCDTILGETVCGDQSSSITEYEYYKPGIGPLSYYLLTTNTFTGGGFTTSHRTEKTLGLVDSSLSAPDGYSPADGPWRVGAEIPISNFDAWYTAGAALNGKIYVVYNGELHIYDPSTDTWSQGPDMTVPGTYSPVALAYANQIYVFQGQDIFRYDPARNTWTRLIALFAFNGGRQQYAVDMLQSNNVDRYGVFFDTNSSGIYFYDFVYGEHQLWSSINFPGTGEDYRSLAVHNDLIYSFGGLYGYQGVWGWVSNYYAHSYKLDPYAASPAWVPLADMPTPRSGAMSVVYGDKIYVIGGGEAGSDASFAVEEYDVASDTWKTKSPSPLGVNYGLAFEVGGKIYLIDDSTYVLEYNPAVDQ